MIRRRRDAGETAVRACLERTSGAGARRRLRRRLRRRPPADASHRGRGPTTVWRGERGSVTAEFAVVVPAVVLVVLLVVAALSLSAARVRLEHGAAQGARLAARGESDERVRAVVVAVAGTAGVTISDEGELVCVAATASAPLPLLPALAADACALSGGR